MDRFGLQDGISCEAMVNSMDSDLGPPQRPNCEDAGSSPRTSGPLVSIVVPVYNVEQYLRQCVDSILVQSHHNLQVVLVDDGSTDSSGQLCDELAELDQRVVVIHQANRGLPAARNAGLDEATGDFVWFVDSDDWIEQRAVEVLLSAARSHSVDGVRMGYFRATETETVQVQEQLDAQALDYSPGSRELFIDILQGQVGAYACLFFLRRDVFDHVHFDEEVPFMEDRAFVADLLLLNPSVMCVDQPLYYYRKNQASLSYAAESSAWKISSFARASVRAVEATISVYGLHSAQVVGVAHNATNSLGGYIVMCAAKGLVLPEAFLGLAKSRQFKASLGQLTGALQRTRVTPSELVVRLMTKGHARLVWQVGRSLRPAVKLRNFLHRTASKPRK